jgi:cell wall-associated NlpC family hydrolase
MEPWLESLIGIPYKRGGGAVDGGIDCYGLVKIIICRVFDIELPDDVIGWRKFATVMPPELAFPIRKWDVLCFEGEGAPLGTIGHVGVAISSADFIHAGEQYGGVVCDSINRWQDRLLHVARPNIP